MYTFCTVKVIGFPHISWSILTFFFLFFALLAFNKISEESTVLSVSIRLALLKGESPNIIIVCGRFWRMWGDQAVLWSPTWPVQPRGQPTWSGPNLRYFTIQYKTRIYIQKRRQRSSLLFGGQNVFNSSPRWLFCTRTTNRMNSSVFFISSGAIHPFLHIILVQFIRFFTSSWCKRASAVNKFCPPNSSDDLCLLFNIDPSSMIIPFAISGWT